MKFSFWMLGLPEWTIEEAVTQAKDWGYHGFDLRVSRQDGKDDQGSELSVTSTDSELERIRKAFESGAIEISSLMCQPLSPTTDPASWDRYAQDIAAHAELARKVGTSRLQICPKQDYPWAIPWDDYTARIWRAVGEGLKGHSDVTEVVIQNHVGRADTERVVTTAEDLGDQRFGVEFSCDHAVVMQEDTFDLIDRYAPRFRKICYADRGLVRDGAFGRYDGEFSTVRFTIVKYGTGHVQSKRMFTELIKRGFDGWIGYKCEPASYPGARMSEQAELMTGFPEWVRSLGVEVPA